ncbi:MAG: hypothetical protein AMXMBFR33_25370 [Candidatus Xenobia bacterium]
MLSRRCFLAGLVALAAVPARARQATVSRAQLSDLINRSSPLARQILNGYAAAPESFGDGLRISRLDLWPLVEGKPMNDLVQCANILVHETCHLFARTQAFEMDRRALSEPASLVVFPEPGKRLFVLGGPSFPARQAVSACPDYLRATFRFSTYFDSSNSQHVCQKDGLYGLLDEMSAYYCGSRAAVELLTFLSQKPKQYAGLWAGLLAGPDGTMAAQQEFRGYVLAYLTWAREHESEVFRSLMANRGLWQAYAAIQKAFAGLVEDWYHRLPALARQVGAEVAHGAILVQGRGLRLQQEGYLELKSRLDKDRELGAMEARLKV